VDAGVDAVFAREGEGAGGEGGEVLFEGVDVVDVEEGQALAAEEDVVLENGAAAEVG